MKRVDCLYVLWIAGTVSGCSGDGQSFFFDGDGGMQAPPRDASHDGSGPLRRDAAAERGAAELADVTVRGDGAVGDTFRPDRSLLDAASTGDRGADERSDSDVEARADTAPPVDAHADAEIHADARSNDGPGDGARADGEASCQRAPSDGSSPPPVDDPHAVIRSVTVAGDLCPPGTEVINISETGEAVTVTFSTGLPGAALPVSARCSVTVEMDEPAGYHIGSPHLQWLGTGGATTLVRGYLYEGGQASRAFVDEISGDYGLVDQAGIWSTSCTTPGRVRFVATIVPLIRANGELFSLYAFDMVTSWRSGVDWRRGCDGGGPLQATPAPQGDWCGGRQARACACGLGCEYDFSATAEKEGTCVDPTQPALPGHLGDPCGGLRSIGCSDGLVCWRATQEAIDRGWLGRCFAPAGGLDATCASGVPALPCAAPLLCSLEPHRCVQATGELDSLCGEGLPLCREGLRCNGTRCAAPRAP